MVKSPLVPLHQNHPPVDFLKTFHLTHVEIFFFEPFRTILHHTNDLELSALSKELFLVPLNL